MSSVSTNHPFNIHFPTGQTAQALHIPRSTSPVVALSLLHIAHPSPVIFVTGGAGAMSPNDIRMTEEMIEALVLFAQERGAIMIDGGTASGIMQMIGTSRARHQLTFTLIGVCPLSKISYPGYENPNAEAALDARHSHFILLDGDAWGDESEFMLGMTQTLSANGKQSSVGVLINGGKIAQNEVFLAATKAFKLPMLIVEGSGRAADEIATAFKTGRANKSILQAILGGGDIQLVATSEGTVGLRTKLASRFK